MQFLKDFNAEFKKPLAEVTTWKVGGPADVFYEPGSAEDLAKFICACKENNVKVYILGGGSNLLVRDEVLHGAIVRVGTAFGGINFYLHEENLYFITNRHVIIKEEEDYIPVEIRLKLHTDQNDVRQNDDYSVRLYNDDGERLWLEHPTGHNEVDVVAIQMNREQVMPRFFIKAFRTEDHIPHNVDISIGEDVLVVNRSKLCHVKSVILNTRNSSLHVAVVPKLKYDQWPEQLPMVVCTLKMFFEQSFDVVMIEKTVLFHAVR